MKTLATTPIAITKGRSPAMDKVTELMDQLAEAISYLPGYPMMGNMAEMPEHPLEATLLLETTRGGDTGQMRHPGSTLLFRWWPEHRVPPESQVIRAG